MTMSEWARNEVEIVCNKNNNEDNDGSCGYINSCYRSALKAYESLMQDGHSGMSFSITADILSRLMKGFPLSPIEDDETWGESDQCKRMSSLFREIDKETGEVTYTDVERVSCRDTNEKGSYTNSFITNVVDRMFPIKMPYFPDGRFYVLIERFSTNADSENWDTMRIVEIKTPKGDILKSPIYWKENEKGELEEITKDEYTSRYNQYINNKEGEEDEL